MRSSSGEYYQRLDHVRAFAAFLVFFWHFVHAPGGVPYTYVPLFSFASLFDEGHIGVALFMTLSGYLFTKLTAGHQINYVPFFWNRAVRLMPLLIVMTGTYACIADYSFTQFALGFVSLTKWPFGAWSVAVEMQFYVLFPLLLFVANRFGPKGLALFLVASLSLRLVIWLNGGQMRYYSYWTIVGCFDYFVAGMIFANASVAKHLNTRTLLGAGLALIVAIHLFNSYGGYYRLPWKHHWVWIILPTAQGVLWGVIIASYERSSIQISKIISAALAWVGEISYSIYLTHLPFLKYLFWPSFKAIGSPSASFLFMSALSIMVFAIVCALASVSYLVIEKPFMKLRRSYKTTPPDSMPATNIPIMA